MTDQSQCHPTQGRRHKNPANIPSTQHVPLPRLLDHMNAADGPSDDEEKEKEAKRQRSAPTTPRSASSTHPNEYDEVMGVTQVRPRDAKRFEEGDDSDFHDAEEHAIRETDTGENTHREPLESSELHGGFGSASLRECVERVLHSTAARATLHSGEGLKNQPTRHRL